MMFHDNLNMYCTQASSSYSRSDGSASGRYRDNLCQLLFRSLHDWITWLGNSLLVCSESGPALPSQVPSESIQLEVETSWVASLSELPAWPCQQLHTIQLFRTWKKLRIVRWLAVELGISSWQVTSHGRCGGSYLHDHIPDSLQVGPSNASRPLAVWGYYSLKAIMIYDVKDFEFLRLTKQIKLQAELRLEEGCLQLIRLKWLRHELKGSSWEYQLSKFKSWYYQAECLRSCRWGNTKVRRTSTLQDVNLKDF